MKGNPLREKVAVLAESLLGDSARARLGLRVASGIAIGGIAILDWKVQPNLSLGYLYVLPMLALGLAMRPIGLAVVATACAVLRESLSPMPWAQSTAEAVARVFVGFLAFAGIGLFVAELARNRQRAIRDARLFAEQVRRREKAEEDLRMLVESSPAAIVIVSGTGNVTVANDAAERLLGASARPVCGQSISSFLPALGSVLDAAEPLYRTALECVGRRGDGEPFLAHVWFSTYRTPADTHLAAIILDTSEELRDRETAGLGAILSASRMLVAAVSHEVKNLCAAAAVAHANLSRAEGLGSNADFVALGTLIDGLAQIASSELRLSADVVPGRVNLNHLLDELRVVLEPCYRDAGARIQWDITDAAASPTILGDHHGLMQIFLNLAQNSLRAMETSEEKLLRISTHEENDAVVVRFRDSGPGIGDNPELFRPFRSGTAGTGLGLFVSRTLARCFAGDLRVEACSSGSCFAVSLARSA